MICEKCKKEAKPVRTNQQNKALHVYFSLISNQLNEMGIEYQYIGLKGQTLGMMHTSNLVKEFVWRKIQVALFGFKSTTQLNTTQINQIIDVLSKFFSERGVNIEFPSIETLTNKLEK